ncbi:MAG TPA: hypothetical protein VFR81_30395 [Longimicrobium sp.]|nr:hypothetical protein [Longimicrobium sp.]
MTASRHARVSILFTAAGLLLAAACGTDEGGAHEGAGGRERRVTVSAWDTTWTVGGSAGDSLLLNPFLIAAGDSAVYVFDGGASRLLAFEADRGGLRWKAGRGGGGPLEFRRVRDLKLAADGSPVLLDIGNRRLTRVSPTGVLAGETSLPAIGYADQMALLADGRTVLLTDHPDSAFAVVDGRGRLVERFAHPWSGFAALHPLVRQGSLASSPDGAWAFGFSLGSGWMAFRGSRGVGALKPYVERAEFPEVVEKAEGNAVTTQLASYAPCSACSVTMDGADFYAHFGGVTPRRRRLLDRYDRQTGEYRESYLLPVEATAVSVAGGTVYALIEEPYPTLLALRPRRD